MTTAVEDGFCTRSLPFPLVYGLSNSAGNPDEIETQSPSGLNGRVSMRLFGSQSESPSQFEWTGVCDVLWAQQRRLIRLEDNVEEDEMHSSTAAWTRRNLQELPCVKLHSGPSSLLFGDVGGGMSLKAESRRLISGGRMERLSSSSVSPLKFFLNRKSI